MSQLNPLTFGDIYGRVAMQFPNNRTVRVLCNAFDQMKVASALLGMRQGRFLPLMEGNDRQGDIAITINAGDGVVTKITDASFAGISHMYPHVVPAFISKFVDLGVGPGVLIESFPYLSRSALPGDVTVVSRQLAEKGLGFARQDDRTDNLRRLPDQTPAIVDGNAVVADGTVSPAAIAEAAQEWHRKIKAVYPVLYAAGFEFGQTEHTDFRLADPPSTVLPNPAAQKRPPPRGGLLNIFRFT